MLDHYLENLEQVRFGTLDSLCKSISVGHGGICAFGDCLGEHLSIAPGARFTPVSVSPECQRINWATSTNVQHWRSFRQHRLGVCSTTGWHAFKRNVETVPTWPSVVEDAHIACSLPTAVYAIHSVTHTVRLIGAFSATSWIEL